MFKKIFVLLSITLIFSCAPSGSDDGIGKVIDSLQTEEPALVVAKEAMEDIVQNVASPVEMAALIQAVGVPFSLEYLCKTNNVDSYDTNYKKALGLGFMGADLGYLNIYSKTTQILSYITVIKKLSDGLKVGQFFDFKTLKDLASNSKNLDSLMYISVNSFNQMDEYLRQNKRGDLSALIIAGVWIEGMYLATQVVKEKPNREIVERIGEQKVILDELLLILRNFKKDENFAEIISDFDGIKTAYKGVEISYKVGEPEAIVDEEGQLTIRQNETSIVEISDEQLNRIISEVEKVRTKLTNL
jgi:hypothetical protein